MASALPHYTSVTSPFQIRYKSVPKNGRKMGFGRDLQGNHMGIGENNNLRSLWSFGHLVKMILSCQYPPLYINIKYLYIVSKWHNPKMKMTILTLTTLTTLQECFYEKDNLTWVRWLAKASVQKIIFWQKKISIISNMILNNVSSTK